MSKNDVTVQKTWSDADIHDEQIADMWNKADDDSVQEQCQWEESWNVCEKWDDDYDDYVLQENQNK